MQTLPYGVLGLDRDEEVTGYHLGACEGRCGYPGVFPWEPQYGLQVRALLIEKPLPGGPLKARWALPWWMSW